MGDRIQKILASLSAKDRKRLTELLELIARGDLDGLDVKKLKGHGSAYRVRRGDFRIIFTMDDPDRPVIIALERRSDTTYRGV